METRFIHHGRFFVDRRGDEMHDGEYRLPDRDCAFCSVRISPDETYAVPSTGGSESLSTVGSPRDLGSIVGEGTAEKIVDLPVYLFVCKSCFVQDFNNLNGTNLPE
jgi:hypothetical protein